jgi:serine/threonine protein kinase
MHSKKEESKRQAVSRPHNMPLVLTTKTSPPSSCAPSLDDGIVEQQLHELLKCLIGWLVSEKTILLKSIYTHNLDQELMLIDIELFLSDELKLRGFNAFEKWILSDASRRYENPASFGSGMDDKPAKLLCVLKRLSCGTELSTQIRLFHCCLLAQAQVLPVAQPAADAGRLPALPANWIQREVQGRPCYINMVTNFTTFDRPAEPSSSILPAGWLQTIDPASGLPFYTNSVTGDKTWTRPVETGKSDWNHPFPAAAAAVPAPAAKPAQGKPPAPKKLFFFPNALPAPWIENFDPASGRPYYTNKETGQSDWNHPFPADLMKDVSDMHGEWYAARCNLFEDGRVFVHFIGFPIECDIIVPADAASSRVRSHVAGTPMGPLHEFGSSFNTSSILAADCPSLLSAVNQSLDVEKELHDAAAMGAALLRQCVAAVISETDDFNTASARFERLITHDIVRVMDTLASIAQDAAEIKSSRLESLQQIAATRKPFCEARANHVPPTEVVLRDEREVCSQKKCAAVERVAELKLMLQLAEQQLQKDIEAEELLTARFSSLQDISSKNSKLVFQEEDVNSTHVKAVIDEHFSGLITRVKFHENECRALQLEIEAAQKTVQTQRESWQCAVCAKRDTEIDCRDVRLLFEHVHVAAAPDLLAAHRVDGKVLTTLSVEVLCKKLGIKSFKEHLLVQHIKSCIANMSLESCVFKVPDDSPLSWSPQQVETWLVQQSLGFVVGAFKAEDLNGMAVLQLDDKLLDHFDVCASSLKHSQEVCTALQRLRASSVTRPKSLAAAGLGSIFLISPSDVISVAHVKPFQGSSGSVQQVKFQGMDAAKKQPHLTRTLNDRDRGKFMKELEIAHKARHPFVVSMLGACVDDDNMFLLMEWMDGGSLFDALGNQVKRPLLARKRVSIAREIAGGLVYLHSSGIIHRDIKSLNVLLTGDNHAKLCDFGLATLHTLTTTATSSREGRPGGTLPWMAPELVLSGSKCSESTDVYSFGVIMWELLTCEVPFEGCNSVQIEAQLRNGFRPDLPDPIPKGFLPEYVALMQRCWHQDASQRPSSQDVHTALLAMDYTAQVNGPIELYPKDYCISPSVTLQSILQTAMPEPSHQLLLARIVAAVRDVFSQAPSFVEQSRTHGLSALEAQCVCAYTLDAQQFQATRESSPFFLYNAALRSRDAAAVGRWRDFSCVFEAALKKLPDNACRVFRGLDCSLTEVSHLYETGGRVWLNSVTSCTTDKQVTMVRTLLRVSYAFMSLSTSTMLSSICLVSSVTILAGNLRHRSRWQPRHVH